MRILITGGKGYVGSKLANKFDDVYVTDYDDGNLVSCPLPDADIIYHLAAHASVEESWNRPIDYMDNLRTTVRLIRDYPNAKIIYANTCSTLDPSSSPYGFSKWAADEYLQRFHKNWVSLMFPNIFGDSPRSVVDIFKNSDSLTIFGDGLQVRDYVHVDDIVEALVLAKDWDKGQYRLGSNKGVAVCELATATGKRIKFAPARNTTPNWKPKIDVIKFLNEKI